MTIYENAYKSGEISLGEFLTKEISMIEYQAMTKEALLNAQILQLDAKEKESLKALEGWKSSLTDTEDKKRAQNQIDQTTATYKKMRENA